MQIMLFCISLTCDYKDFRIFIYFDQEDFFLQYISVFIIIGLYRRGLVYLDVPIQDDDFIICKSNR